MRNLYQLMESFCTRKLAEQLYVDCVDPDRALADWNAAQNFVARNQGFVLAMVTCFPARLAQQLSGTTKFASIGDTNTVTIELLLDYKSFDRLCGRDVWDALYQRIQKCLPVTHGPIRFH